MATKVGTNLSDTITGTEGNDYIYGLGAVDTLRGGGGADYIDGGASFDWAYYDTSPAGVTVNLKTSRGHGGDAEGDTLVSIEHLMGSEYADILVGNDGMNFIQGNRASDTLYGLDGNDRLSGDIEGDTVGGDDRLKGGGGDDELVGFVGDDYLNGGLGRDLIFGDYLHGGGGGGADTFSWWYTSETGTTEVTADVVFDFHIEDGDRIEFSHIDADVYSDGNQGFTFIGNAAFSGTPGEVRYYHSNGSTYIAMQTGTSVDVEGLIGVYGIHTPEASWFVL